MQPGYPIRVSTSGIRVNKIEAQIRTLIKKILKSYP